MNTKHLNPQQPYERFLRFGAENLTEAELLAIILRTGTKDKNAIEVAEAVLEMTRYPNKGLGGLYNLSLKDLMSIKGIGEVKAVRLKCITELSMRICSSVSAEGVYFQKSGQVANYYMERMRHRETECAILLSLDSKGRLLRETRLSEGSVRMALLSAREIFLEALDARAVNILLLHNHPSGDPTPSQADINITRDIKDMGEKMDIPLLDHIIIGDNKYVSFMEMGWYANN